MNHLPGWIQVALALMGLFGGPAAGVYYGGVRRTRLEDRRRLLSDHSPWIEEGLLFDPARTDRGSAWGDLGQIPEQTAELVQRIANRIQEINELVRLLPFKDRALWHRVLEELAAANPRAVQDAFS